MYHNISNNLYSKDHCITSKYITKSLLIKNFLVFLHRTFGFQIPEYICDPNVQIPEYICDLSLIIRISAEFFLQKCGVDRTVINLHQNKFVCYRLAFK